MFPYCDLRQKFLSKDDPKLHSLDWNCVHSILVGSISAILFIICLYGVLVMTKKLSDSSSYGLNVLILLLCTLQCFFNLSMYIFLEDSKLSICASYLRALQTIIACAIASHKVAYQSHSLLFNKYFLVTLGSSILFCTIFLIIACFEPVLKCYYSHWIIMSSFQLFIVILFTIPTFKIIMNKRKISSETNIFEIEESGPNSDSNIEELKSLKKCYLGNIIGAISQFFLDISLQNIDLKRTDCLIINFQFGDLVRTLLKIIAFHLPVIILINVYFVPGNDYDKNKIKDRHHSLVESKDSNDIELWEYSNE